MSYYEHLKNNLSRKDEVKISMVDNRRFRRFFKTGKMQDGGSQVGFAIDKPVNRNYRFIGPKNSDKIYR
jgi:hypothetical protein